MVLHSPKALKSSTSGAQQIFTPQFAVEAVNNQDEVGLDRWKQNSELFLGQLVEKPILSRDVTAFLASIITYSIRIKETIP